MHVIIVYFSFVTYLVGLVFVKNCVLTLQYPDYIDAYLRFAAIAKARNNLQLSIELVVIPITLSLLILSLSLSQTNNS